jgi:hypothetical protein
MWGDIGIAALLLIGVYCFLRLIGWQVRAAGRRSNRRAEDLYDQYADSPRAQRKYARKRGGQWRDEPRAHTHPRSPLVRWRPPGRPVEDGHRAEKLTPSANGFQDF